MSTEQDLHSAFINFSTDYLIQTDRSEVDVKMVEIISRYLDKKDISSLSAPTAGFDQDVLAKVKKEHGVK